MILLLTSDGRQIPIHMDCPPTLEFVHEKVGGYAEVVELVQEDQQLIVNEAGIELGLELNEYVTSMLGFPIVGDALLLTDHNRWE